MVRRQHPAIALLAVAALGLPGCGPDEEILPLPETTSLEWKGLYTNLYIDDFEGKYSMRGKVTTGFDPLFAVFKADVFSEDGYSEVDEDAEVVGFALEVTDRPQVNGRDVLRFQQTVKMSTLSCVLEMEGFAQELHDPQEEYWNEDAPFYTYVGPVALSCLTDSVTMEAEVFYNEPGTIVGEVNGRFVTEVVEGHD